MTCYACTNVTYGLLEAEKRVIKNIEALQHLQWIVVADSKTQWRESYGDGERDRMDVADLRVFGPMNGSNDEILQRCRQMSLASRCFITAGSVTRRRPVAARPATRCNSWCVALEWNVVDSATTTMLLLPPLLLLLRRRRRLFIRSSVRLIVPVYIQCRRRRPAHAAII